MVKRGLLILLVTILIIGGVGCMFFKKSYSLNERRDLALDYLKDKHGEGFIAKSIVPNNWAYCYDEIYLYPKNDSEEDMFVVEGTLIKDGTYVMHDGYYGILIKTIMKLLCRDF